MLRKCFTKKSTRTFIYWDKKHIIHIYHMGIHHGSIKFSDKVICFEFDIDIT